MSDLRVTVTVEDLDRATANRDAGVGVCRGCPVAVALSREMGRTVEVGFDVAWIARTAYPPFLVPPLASELMNDFDNQNDDALRSRLPVSFVIQLPVTFVLEARS